jgi:hypothetical protein
MLTESLEELDLRLTELIPESQRGLTRVESYGNGERTIASVKRVLRKTGILKALSRARWMP